MCDREREGERERERGRERERWIMKIKFSFPSFSDEVPKKKFMNRSGILKKNVVSILRLKEIE